MRFAVGLLAGGLLVVVPTALSASEPSPYRFPWPPGLEIELTQDCNDSRYNGHVGNNGWAWDFATPDAKSFPILVARGGTVTHVKMSSSTGCSDASCMDYANYVVIDHGDGTSSVYLHLEHGTLAPGIRCGEKVVQGQPLAMAGSTGFATGVHLHYQVNKTRPARGPSCECGPDGMACADDYANWWGFWSSASYPTLPVRFEEWPSDVCEDRTTTLPPSHNHVRTELARRD